MLICPICAQPLIKLDKAMKCEKGHSFDIASAGYCNLLVGSKPGDFIGDSKEMVMARRRFLDSGAYEPLRSAQWRRRRHRQSDQRRIRTAARRK